MSPPSTSGDVLARWLRRQVLIGLLVALPALAFLVVVGADLVRGPGFGDRGVRTTATVLRVDPDTFGAQVRFDAGGQQVTTRVRPAPRASPEGPLIVEYDRENPARAVAVTAGGEGGAVLALATGVGVTALGGWLALRALRHARAVRAAVAAPGVPVQVRFIERYALVRGAGAQPTDPAELAVPLLKVTPEGDQPRPPSLALLHGVPEPGGVAVPVVDGEPVWPSGRVQEPGPVEQVGYPRPGPGAWPPAD